MFITIQLRCPKNKSLYDNVVLVLVLFVRILKYRSISYKTIFLYRVCYGFPGRFDSLHSGV